MLRKKSARSLEEEESSRRASLATADGNLLTIDGGLVSMGGTLEVGLGISTPSGPVFRIKSAKSFVAVLSRA